MSSQFIGLQVKLTLHSQPGTTLQAKILAIDQASNTLTVQKQDGLQSVLKRTDIASLAACKPQDSASNGTAAAASSKKSSHAHTATPGNSGHHTDTSKPQATNHLTAPLQGSDPVESRSSTPSRSPRPKPATAVAPQSKPTKKKQTPVSRGSSPAIANANLSDDFDFSAGLKAFDKKKIWDDIRASDHTDPASLLVSHNRISNGPVELVRGPNGVGPANSVSTPDRGRTSAKDGQQKLRPNEMVCSPSPERVPSPAPAAPLTSNPGKPAQTATTTGSEMTGKPTYEQLEERVKKLEAELALARRRNALLEELAGLGLGVPTRHDASTAYTSAPPSSSPPRPERESKASTLQHEQDPSVGDTEKGLGSLSLQDGPSKSESAAPSALSSALAAAGFAVSSNEASTDATSAPMTPTSTSVFCASDSKEADAEKEEPLFGHIVDPPVLTLLFPTAALQHAALARMEAFYESNSNSKSYLTLQQAADERICRNYQGFNFPVRQGVQEWLDAMYEATGGDQDAAKWWTPHCSPEENQLLDVLISRGTIAPNEGSFSRSPDPQGGSISYVISCVASQAHSTLPHELLHALYFLSPSYRALVSHQYASLSAANKKVIETDLGMRKYSPAVFEDEFQAYLAEGLGTEKEFGNKPAEECKEIAQQLRSEVGKEWAKLGLDLESGRAQERWEEVKWQTLDRYAALQKAVKKNKGKTGSPAKGGKKSKK